MQSNASITPFVFSSTSAYRSGSVAVSTPRMYDGTGRDSAPTGYLTADMYLSQCNRAGLAQTPYQYATVDAEPPINLLDRPGGGTGVIPSTPVGDSIVCLLILVMGYTLVRSRRR